MSPAVRRVPSPRHIPVAPQAPVSCAGYLHTPILQKNGTGGSQTSGTDACFHVISGAGALRKPRGRPQAATGFGDSEGYRRLRAAIWGLSHRWVLRVAVKFPRPQPKDTPSSISAGGRQAKQMRALKLEIPFLAQNFCPQWFEWS